MEKYQRASAGNLGSSLELKASRDPAAMPEWRVKGRQKHASRRNPGLASAGWHQVPLASGSPSRRASRRLAGSNNDDDAVDFGDTYIGNDPKFWAVGFIVDVTETHLYGHWSRVSDSKMPFNNSARSSLTRVMFLGRSRMDVSPGNDPEENQCGGASGENCCI